MLTDRSFVLTVTDPVDGLAGLRAELTDRLPPSSGLDDEVLLVAGLLVRQAQTWRGGVGPVRVRCSTLGQVVSVEVNRDVDEAADSGPACEQAFLGLLEVLAHRSDRFTVSTFPGLVSLAAQKQVCPVPQVLHLDLRAAA